MRTSLFTSFISTKQRPCLHGWKWSALNDVIFFQGILYKIEQGVQGEEEQPLKASDNEPEWMSIENKCIKQLKLCIPVR